MQVLQYLLDDVSEFLSTKFVAVEGDAKVAAEGKGCLNVLKAFIEFISERERDNFRSRRHDNEKSITLTTIHQVFFSDIQLNLLGLSCCCSGGFFGNIPMLNFVLMPLFFLLQSKGLEWDVVFIVKVLDHIGLLALLAMLKWLHLYYTTIIL